jgi:hypothetical protein
MKSTSLLIAGLVAGFLSLGAMAQPGPGGGPGGGPGCGQGGGPGCGQGSSSAGPGAADCSKARNPQHCESRQKAREACKGKKGTEYRQCVKDSMPPPDCSKAKNPQRCEAQQAAREACKGKFGREHRQCMRDQQKPAAPPAKK